MVRPVVYAPDNQPLLLANGCHLWNDLNKLQSNSFRPRVAEISSRNIRDPTINTSFSVKHGDVQATKLVLAGNCLLAFTPCVPPRNN